MLYQLAFGFFVGKKPTGWNNLLLATLCLLIPVVGPIVLLGYQAEVAERLVRDPELRKHPDFKFDRFMDLLTRGLWPFLINMIGQFVLMPVVLAAVFIPIAVGGAANMPGLGLAVGILLTTVVSFAATAVLMPLSFHAELANRFDIGGGFRFAMSFLKLVGGKAVVAYVVYSLLSIPVTLVGLLVCCVGVYPAAILLLMAAQHLMVQLYVEYLNRGGEEIEKTEPDRRRRDDRDDDDENSSGGYDIDTPPRRTE